MIRRLRSSRKRAKELPGARHGGGRITKRTRRIWRILFSRTAFLVLSLVCLASLAYYLYEAPYFRISQVTVTGLQKVEESKIVGLAAVDGQSIIDVRTKTIAERVKSLPLVKDAVATLVIPNQVNIEITERQPWAVWQSGATKYVIDDDGIVLNMASGKTDGMITVTESPTRTLQVGNRVDQQVVKVSQSLIESLPRELGVVPRRFDYSQPTGLTVTTDKGWQVRFGDGKDLETKIATAKAILATTKEAKTKVSFIDLRFGGRPYFR